MNEAAAFRADRPPRVLVVHNRYQQRGGEDVVVEDEVDLLAHHGHEVELFAVHNDELNTTHQLTAAVDTLWSPRAHQRMRALLERFKPDLLHVHNTFPLISPSIYWAAQTRRVPVVQSVHNFRLICPGATLYREGRICEECVGRLPLPALRHRCYRGSLPQTAATVAMLGLHRALGTYQRKIDIYIAMTEAARGKLIEGGLPAHKIRLKPNFAADRGPPPVRARAGGLFVGRLSPEKGLDVLADAIDRIGRPCVTVIGGGDLAGFARQRFGAACVGVKDRAGVIEAMEAAAWLVVPSTCYETFPRGIVEAYGAGLPVIASRLGGMLEIVRDGHTGLLFEAGNSRDLAESIDRIDGDPAACATMARNARSEFEARYSPSRNYDMLMDIYREALRRPPAHAARAAS